MVLHSPKALAEGSSGLAIEPRSPDLAAQLPPQLLPSVQPWIWGGSWVLITAVLGAGAFAALARYDTTVSAQGVVRPAGDLRVVQAAQEGTVTQLLVQDTQTVRRGDVLVELDDSKLQSRRQQLEGNLHQDRQQLLQLQAQLRALEAYRSAEASQSDFAIAAADSELDRIQRDHADKSTNTQTDVAEAEALVTLAREERDRYANLAASGAVAVSQIKEKEALLRSAEARLARAQVALTPSQAPMQVAAAQISQQQAKQAAVLANLTKEREALGQQQAQLQSQLGKTQTELTQVIQELERSTIRATADGTILQLSLRNPGQVVRPGEAIAQIAPSQLPLVVKARLAGQDVEKISPGQKVQMKIGACPYPDYGLLTGVVKTVAPDALASAGGVAQITPSIAPLPAASTTSQFEVMIQPETTKLQRGDRRCQLQPGMDLNANIITREDTLLRFFLRKARLITDL
jgi:HlyD family type I secretion membrane fusion protein